MSKIEDKYYRKTRQVEDRFVLDFLQKEYGETVCDILEVGSGLGRFAMKLKEQTSSRICCIEKNPEPKPQQNSGYFISKISRPFTLESN